MANLGIPRGLIGKEYDIEFFLGQQLIEGQFGFDGRSCAAAVESAVTTVDQKVGREKKLKSDAVLEKEDLGKFSSFQGTLDLPVALQAFRRYLAKECSDEHLEFLLKVRAFQKLCRRLPPVEEAILKEVGEEIFEDYVREGSPREINISTVQRAELRKRVMTGRMSETAFAVGMKEVLELLTKDSWQRFIASPVYNKVKERIRFMNLEIIRPRNLLMQFPQDEDGRSILNEMEIPYEQLDHPCSLVQDMLVSFVDTCDRYVTPFGQRVDFRALGNSFDITKLLRLTCELQKVDVAGLKEFERASFFINVYNLLSLAVRIVFGFSYTATDMAFQNSSYAFNIGGFTYTLDDIQMGILQVGVKKEWKPFKKNDARRQVALNEVDCRHLFCLSRMSTTCPVMHIFDKEREKLKLQVDASTKEYLDLHVHFSELARTLYLPRMFKTSSKEFGERKIDMLQWIVSRLTESKRKVISPHMKEGAPEIELCFHGHTSEWDYIEVPERWFVSPFTTPSSSSSPSSSPSSPSSPHSNATKTSSPPAASAPSAGRAGSLGLKPAGAAVSGAVSGAGRGNISPFSIGPQAKTPLGRVSVGGGGGGGGGTMFPRATLANAGRQSTIGTNFSSFGASLGSLGAAGVDRPTPSSTIVPFSCFDRDLLADAVSDILDSLEKRSFLVV